MYLALAVALGLLLGVGAFTFVYARGASYLTSDPAACANCHVMSEHYAAWMKSSHRAVAVCNDCHAPHELGAKYLVKARNGFWHSVAFTTGRFPDPLRITSANRDVTERACRHCHGAIAQGIEHGTGATPAGDRMRCARCHRYVGHLVR